MRMLTLFTVVLLVVTVSLASAGEMRRVKAIGVAETALGRAIAVGSDQIIPKEKLRDAVPGDLYPVHHPRTLEQAYGIVPILSPDGKVVGLIGVDATSSKAIWYSFSPRGETFPPVSSETARRRVQLKAGPAGQEIQASEPILLEGYDKHLYWRFETGSGEALFVDSDGPEAEILSTMDGSAERVTVAPRAAFDQEQMPNLMSEPAGPVPQLMNGTRPAAYDIVGIPYHYQITDMYCGPASMQMVFDYWGEEIPQHDIADVIFAGDDTGSWWGDIGKGMSFSGIATAKNDPTLHGYNERQLGLAGTHYSWYGQTAEVKKNALKDLIVKNYPVLVLSWYSITHSTGHYRVVRGYDDSLSVFIFHDPYYGGAFNGPYLLIDQDVWAGDLWSESWGTAGKVWTVTPWGLDMSYPASVSQGDTFTVDLKVLYPGPYPTAGYDAIHDGTASISLSAGLALAGGSVSQSIPDIASGDSVTVSWDVVASGSPGEWGMGFAAQGILDRWAYSYGTTSDSIGSHTYETVEIGGALAATWGSEERLTTDNLTSETCVPHARAMAVDDDGTTHIVWKDSDAGGSYVRYMKRIAGTWQTPDELVPGGSFCHSPCIAVDPAGGVHVAWSGRWTDNKYYIFYKSWTSGGGWSLEERVTNLLEVDCFPSIAADDSLVHIAYEHRLGGLYRAHAVFHTFRNALGWSAPVDLDAAAARDSFRPSLAIGADGLLHIVYERHTANDPNELEKVVHKSWDGIIWSARTGLSSTISYSRTPSIAAGDDSTLHVVWQDGENLGGDIFYSKFDGIAWQVVPDQIVAGTTEACTPSVDVDANGDVYVAWVDYRHSEPEIYLMSDDGSGWSAHARFTDATGQSMLPCVCAVGDGSVSVLWADLRHGYSEIYFRGPSEGAGVPVTPVSPATPVSLSAPWPQPFTDEVRLMLSLGRAADIDLNVYDVEGRVVRKLASGSHAAGMHEISWDGRGAGGGMVAPGVYFVSCSTPLGQHARRVVVLR